MNLIGKAILFEGIAKFSVTHGDKKSPVKKIVKKLSNPVAVVTTVLLFFTVKVAAEQLVMIIVRHQ